LPRQQGRVLQAIAQSDGVRWLALVDKDPWQTVRCVSSLAAPSTTTTPSPSILNDSW
jgi:hypothetical protein